MAYSKIIAPLGAGDLDFWIASSIERGAKTMMVRELAQNAIECAQGDDSGVGSVLFNVVKIDGVPKLAIWNSGRGLDGDELLRMTNLSSSIRKDMRLDANFGVGAKVASLPCNRHGMRYRSCHAGTVHEVTLGFREGIYGRIKYDVDGYIQEMVDVSDEYPQETLASDWTEVVLYGNDASQNTVEDPYGDGEKVERQWLAQYLYHRFFRIPENVNVSLGAGTHKLEKDKSRPFKTLTARSRMINFQGDTTFEKWDVVETAEGVKIHFVFDAPIETSKGHNKSIGGALQTETSLIAVVFKNEMYDVRTGRAWTAAAPSFGIPYGARHISIFIELPDNSKVVPEMYRRFLNYADGTQKQVEANDYAPLVESYRPEWVSEKIRSLAPNFTPSAELDDELRKFFQDLKAKNTATTNAKAVASGPLMAVTTSEKRETEKLKEKVGVKGGGSSNGHQSTTDDKGGMAAAPKGAKTAKILKDENELPDIDLVDEAGAEEKDFAGRAGRFYPASGGGRAKLFVNKDYPAIARLRDNLEREYANSSDIDLVREHASSVSQATVTRLVARAAICALAKRHQYGWEMAHIEKALSPESLSMAADDFEADLQNLRRQMSKKFSKGTTNPLFGELADLDA